jgi:hypothetical protein
VGLPRGVNPHSDTRVPACWEAGSELSPVLFPVCPSQFTIHLSRRLLLSPSCHLLHFTHAQLPFVHAVEPCFSLLLSPSHFMTNHSGTTVVVATRSRRRRVPPRSRAPSGRARHALRPRQRPLRRLRRSSGNWRSPAMSRLPQSALCYLQTLNDPFEYPGCRLGFGTLAATQLATGYLRFSSTCNGDGSWAGVFWPSTGSEGNPGLYINQNGAASTSAWTAIGELSNSAAINSAVAAGRVISAGMRVIPQVAATVAPGLGFAGAIQDFSTNLVNTTSTGTLTVNGVTNMPNMVMGHGNCGALAVSRPLDTDSSLSLTLTLLAPLPVLRHPSFLPPSVRSPAFPPIVRS